MALLTFPFSLARSSVGLLAALACAVGGAVAAERASAALSAVPYGPRTAARGATMFALLSPEETGIRAENRYDDPAMWRERYREFSLGAIGTGVAIGDYDGDGRPDIFVVCKTGPNHLFRNLGGFRFEDVTEHAGVGGPVATPAAWSQGAAFVDVNNDGRLDLYVCRYASPNLLYINQGDGTFKEEAAARGLALTDASGMAAFCDYDRDGWLDVYIQTNLLDGERHPNGQRDRLFRNNRDGTFTEVTDAAGIAGTTQGHAATWWDYNEDGWPDLYIDNDFKDPDQLYHNNGDGTFTNVLSWVVPHTPHSSMGADLGDLNNDGHLDLFVADMAATTRVKDHRGMARMREGLMDDEQRPEAAAQYMRDALFLNTGTGVMLEAAELAGLPATDWTWSVRFEDLDDDGRLDAFFTNGMIRELHSTDIAHRMMTKESMADRIRVMRATPVLEEQNLAFRNLGDLRFENVSKAWGLDQVCVAFGAAFGDLDGDGDLDLLYTRYDGNVTVCRNDSDAGHSITVALRGTTSNRFGVGATVRIETAAGPQVRTLTLARGYLSTSEPMLHFGLGELTTVNSLTITWPSGRVQRFTDLAADQRYTLTESAENAIPPPAPPPPPLFVETGEKQQLHLASHEGPLNQLNQEPLVPFRFDRPGPSATLADFDGDGQDDLVVGGAAGENGRVFSNLGGGQYLEYGTTLFSARSAVEDGPILAVDLDGDGDLDLLATKAGIAAPAGTDAYQPQIFLNDGRGGFDAGPADLLPPLPLSVGAAAAADFEHTGRLGIFLGGRIEPGRYPAAPRSALLAWRDGRYVDVTDTVAPGLSRRGMVTAALWTDVDGDGWIDLLVAYAWGPVACYRNVDGRRFEEASAKFGFDAAGHGWWTSLAAADFNGDGRLDYVAGNVGLNTRYHASPEAPATLYAGVVLDGSAPSLVEAELVDGHWYPLRAREALTKVFPSLARRYPTGDAFSVATLDEVFPGDALKNATRLTATELRSGVFLSQPDGTYRFAALPRMAQIAPFQGAAAGDFDGDGAADILVVGNSFAPVPENGRFDGGIGWLLHGDGRGGFTPVPATESGIIVRRDAKALAVTDFDQDGWPDFFVTRNNDRSLAYRNRGRPDGASFGVALRGPAGNPAAIGARLTLTLADGATQTAEIAAGSGYFSQSGGTVFFGYRPATPPAKLRVRWPDGRETEHVFATLPSRLLRLSPP